MGQSSLDKIRPPSSFPMLFHHIIDEACVVGVVYVEAHLFEIRRFRAFLRSLREFPAHRLYEITTTHHFQTFKMPDGRTRVTIKKLSIFEISAQNRLTHAAIERSLELSDGETDS